MPLPGNVEWLIAGQIFDLLDNSTSFYISALGSPNVYTDIRLAVPITYYDLSHIFVTLKKAPTLVGISFDNQGNYFIEKYFSDKYKTRLIGENYNLLGIWSRYYIIFFD
ncbi:MAG: hypothetical protein ACP5IE_04630 [Infirmifilum sp.]